MKIGIVLIYNNNQYRGGTNSYIRGLLDGFQKTDEKDFTYEIIVFEKDREYFKEFESTKIKVVSLVNENRIFARIRDKIMAYFYLPLLSIFCFVAEKVLFRRVIRDLNNLDLDVCYYPVIQHPLSIRAKTVISPHDIQPLHFPENFPFYARVQRNVTCKMAMKSGTIIQASSNFIGKDFEDSYNLLKQKVAMIPEGVGDDFLNFVPVEENRLDFLKRLKLEAGYIFYPSQHWPHKNHKTLLLAVAYVREKYGLDLKLVLTGEKMPMTYKDLYDFIETNDYQRFVRFIGNLKYNDLFYAYLCSSVVVLPVVYESSSLPLKEAAAIGVPVIASRNGANDEMEIDGNILLFNTFDYVDLGDKIYKLLSDGQLRHGMITKSKKLILDYRWVEIANQYNLLFKKINYGN